MPKTMLTPWRSRKLSSINHIIAPFDEIAQFDEHAATAAEFGLGPWRP
jgi:hypothetical protein